MEGYTDDGERIGEDEVDRRNAFLMYLQGSTPPQIAKALGRSYPTTCNFLFRPSKKKRRLIAKLLRLRYESLREIVHVFCEQGEPAYESWVIAKDPRHGTDDEKDDDL